MSTQALCLSTLPTDARAQLTLWELRMQKLQEHGRGWTRFAEEIAPEWGRSFGTISRMFTGWKKHGRAALLDKRVYGSYLGIGEVRGLPQQFVQHWQGRVESFTRAQGGIKAAWDLVLHELNRWRRGNGPAIPGYAVPPRNQPGKKHPAGWSYENLSRCVSEKVALDMARLGRAAAKRYMPKVYTTRVGLQVGQVICGDDQWHDVDVAWNHGQVTRPLSYDLVDLCSAYEIIHGMQPRVKNDDGTNTVLKEMDFYWLLLTHFTINGYRADVCTHVIQEAGSATVRAALAEGFRLGSENKILFSTGGTDTRAVKGLLFDGPGKGNPRFKALREGLFGLFRTYSGFLPGATGPDRDQSPEEWSTVKNYVQKLLDKVPQERWHLLTLPILTEPQYRSMVGLIKAALNDRTEHEIEGWEQLGFLRMEYRSSMDSAEWRDLEDLQKEMLNLPPARREMIALELSAHGSQLTRQRRLSPTEVWESQRHHLTRLPVWKWNLVMPGELARKRIINDSRELAIHDLGPDVVRYDARCVNSVGDEVRLRPGTEVLLYINPFLPDQILCCDTAGAAKGVMHRIVPSTKIDHEGFLRRMGEVRQQQADVEHDVARRAAPVAQERREMIVHNERVVNNLPVTPEEKRNARAGKRAAKAGESVIDSFAPAAPAPERDDEVSFL